MIFHWQKLTGSTKTVVLTPFKDSNWFQQVIKTSTKLPTQKRKKRKEKLREQQKAPHIK